MDAILGSAAAGRADTGLPHPAAVDLEGQPRPWGAASDVGADEKVPYALSLASPEGPRASGTVHLRHLGEGGQVWLVLFSVGTYPPGFPITGLTGRLLLDAGAALVVLHHGVVPSSSFADLRIPIPSDPAFTGMRFSFQSLGLQSSALLSGGFSDVVAPAILPD